MYEKLIKLMADHFELEAMTATEKQERAEHETKSRAAKAQYNAEKHEWTAKVIAGTTFEISKVYRAKNWAGERHELLEIEGIEMAMQIFQDYRSNGHSLNLHSLTLTLNGERVRKVTFKYKS